MIVVIVLWWWWWEWHKYAGSNFLGKQLCRSFREVVVSALLVSWWSLNCVSVVVGVLWHFGGVSVVSWRCSVIWVLCSCFGGVCVVSRRCSRGALGYWRNGIFLTKLAHLSIPKWRQKERETLLLGLSAGLILSMFFSSTLLCDRDGMAGWVLLIAAAS